MFNQKLSHTLSENKNFKFTNGDVRDYDLIKNLVKDIEAIIPLAAIVGAPLSKKLPNDTFEINQESIEKLVKFRNFIGTNESPMGCKYCYFKNGIVNRAI